MSNGNTEQPGSSDQNLERSRQIEALKNLAESVRDAKRPVTNGWTLYRQLLPNGSAGYPGDDQAALINAFKQWIEDQLTLARKAAGVEPEPSIQKAVEQARKSGREGLESWTSAWAYYVHKASTKQLAQWTGVSESTVRNILESWRIQAVPHLATFHGKPQDASDSHSPTKPSPEHGTTHIHQYAQQAQVTQGKYALSFALITNPVRTESSPSKSSSQGSYSDPQNIVLGITAIAFLLISYRLLSTYPRLTLITLALISMWSTWRVAKKVNQVPDIEKFWALVHTGGWGETLVGEALIIAQLYTSLRAGSSVQLRTAMLLITVVGCIFLLLFAEGARWLGEKETPPAWLAWPAERFRGVKGLWPFLIGTITGMLFLFIIMNLLMAILE